ncbi:MAG TPA: hypothetical protein VGK67_31470 [Myxococcales bacterium]|jgi:hypothetical protein
MKAIARLHVRGMRDHRRVLVSTPDAALRHSLSASLERASRFLPGTSAEPAAPRTEQVLCGAVRSPLPLGPSEMRAFADVVAQLLAADGYEISEPIEVEEGLTGN